jgi:hypothetical protein
MRRAANRRHDATQGLVRDSRIEGSPMNRLLQRACVLRAACCGLDLTPPQSSKEPAGIALGAGSAGEASHRKKPEGGRPWMAGRFRETGCRVGNRRWGADPARRAIDKRPRFAALPQRVAGAWPRGRYPPALATQREREAEGEPTKREKRRDSRHAHVNFTSILGVHRDNACYKVRRPGGSGAAYGSSF